MKISRLLTTSFLALTIAAQCSAPPEEQVMETFQTYKSAILDKNGELAYEQVDANTRKRYARTLDHALNLSAVKTRELPIVDMMEVLMARHMIEPETLQAMDGKGFFVHAVNEGWIDEQGVRGLEIEIQSVEGTKATTHVKKGEITAPIGFEFNLEDEKWKIDLTSILGMAEKQFQGIIDQSGMSTEELMFAVLMELSGQQPTATIWEPLNQ
ncbi:MAG: hypothetical protein RH862_19675 [Leptospiraceae bacterium]